MQNYIETAQLYFILYQTDVMTGIRYNTSDVTSSMVAKRVSIAGFVDKFILGIFAKLLGSCMCSFDRTFLFVSFADGLAAWFVWRVSGHYNSQILSLLSFSNASRRGTAGSCARALRRAGIGAGSEPQMNTRRCTATVQMALFSLVSVSMLLPASFYMVKISWGGICWGEGLELSLFSGYRVDALFVSETIKSCNACLPLWNEAC